MKPEGYGDTWVFEDATIGVSLYDGDPIIVSCGSCGEDIGYGGEGLVSLDFSRIGYRCDECGKVWQIILWDVTEEANS